MKKRFIIIPIAALATLGLNASVILANNKVSVINDRVYIEEGANIDVDWNALKKLAINKGGLKKEAMYTSSVVSVRSSAVKGEILGILPFGTEVEVIAKDEENDWYQIAYNDGTGWISSAYVVSGTTIENTATKDISIQSVSEDGTNYDSEYTVTTPIYLNIGEKLTIEKLANAQSNFGSGAWELLEDKQVCYNEAGTYSTYCYMKYTSAVSNMYKVNITVVVTDGVSSTPEPTSTVTPTAAPSSTQAPASSTIPTATNRPISQSTSQEKSVQLSYGKELSLVNLGFDVTAGRYTYEYEKANFGKKCTELGTFHEVIIQTDGQTGNTITYTVHITVVDDESPTLKGVKNVIRIVGGKDVVKRIKKGVTAKDNIDGNITKRIKISGYKAKKYDKVQKVTFTVKDKAGNITKKTVKLKITNPVKKLNKYMYTKTAINVRSTSSAKGKKLGKLAFGKRVKVIGQDRNTGWYKIRFNGKTGWVNNSYMTNKKPSKPTKTPSKGNNDSSVVGDNGGYNCVSGWNICDADGLPLDCFACSDCVASVDGSNGGW